jgi:hypothetical protein
VLVNLPASGTLEITTGGVMERVRYQGLDAPTRTVTVVARGVDGTTAIAHSIGDPVTNGEQIRPGNGAQFWAGYAGLAEAQYLLVATMEIVNRAMDPSGANFVVELAGATEAAPVVLTGDPFTLLLQVLLSTGSGTNSVYDVLSAVNGVGIPQSLVDIAGIEAVRAAVGAPPFSFDIRSEINAKEWIETEILKVCNCYPLVNQFGQYTIKRYRVAVPQIIPGPQHVTTGALGTRTSEAVA